MLEVTNLLFERCFFMLALFVFRFAMTLSVCFRLWISLLYISPLILPNSTYHDQHCGAPAIDPSFAGVCVAQSFLFYVVFVYLFVLSFLFGCFCHAFVCATHIFSCECSLTNLRFLYTNNNIRVNIFHYLNSLINMLNRRYIPFCISVCSVLH